MKLRPFNGRSSIVFSSTSAEIDDALVSTSAGVADHD